MPNTRCLRGANTLPEDHYLELQRDQDELGLMNWPVYRKGQLPFQAAEGFFSKDRAVGCWLQELEGGKNKWPMLSENPSGFSLESAFYMQLSEHHRKARSGRNRCQIWAEVSRKK